MAEVRFDKFTQKSVLPQRVYFKFRWLDDWTLMPAAWCMAATWTSGVRVPVAHVRWRYGIVLEPQASAYIARFRMAGRLRHYVKVEYDCQQLVSGESEGPLRWHGFFDTELDDFFGAMQDTIGNASGIFASGTNHFVCSGLEGLLDRKCVSDSVLENATARIPRALTFNEGGLGNRSADKGPDGVYVFSSKAEESEYWSTADIIAYLLMYQSPRYADGGVTIPFELDDFLALPKWDKPVVEAEGFTLLEIFNALMPRQRLLGWRLEVSNNKVLVVPFTLTDEAIFVPYVSASGPHVAANPYVYTVALPFDRTGTSEFRRSATDIVDQVIVKGARRTSTATFSFADQTLAIGWTNALETEYEAGASTSPDYPPAAEEGLRMTRNYLARAADKFSRVYARYVLANPFSGSVLNGLGLGDPEPLMPDDDDYYKNVPLAPVDARFTAMAMLDGVDYSVFPPDLPPPNERKAKKPIVLYPRSDSTSGNPKYRQVDAVGIAIEAPESLEAGDVWSAMVQVGADGALWVQIQSAPREFLAGPTFSRLDCDIDPALYGNADYHKLVATLCVEWSAFAEAAYPPKGSLSTTVDAIRTLEIKAGENFRCDYIVPGTITGIVPATAALVRNVGGFIRDDREQLGLWARIAYEWYRKVRTVASWQSGLLTSRLRIGDYIKSVHDSTVEGDVQYEDINSVLTLIHVDSPLVESEVGGDTPVPHIKFETSFGEIDPLALR